MSISSLKGKVAVITGASSGIGRAITEKLCTLGVRCVISGRRGQRLQEVADQTGALPVTGDLLDPNLPGLLLSEAKDRFGGCQIVVNNAGVMEVGSVEQADIEKFCRMARINVEGAYRVAYTFAKHFVAHKEGHLVNISSILGTKVRPTAGAYAGTKYAIEALTEALRMELAGTGVGVYAVEPGLVMTELHDHWDTHPKDNLNMQQPLQPEDIANAVAFILQQPAHVRIPRIMVLPGEHAI